MAVAWRSVGTYASRASANTSTLTVTQPAGHQANDFLMLVAGSFNAAGSSPVAINDPSGWTPIANSGGWAVNNKGNTTVWYKIAASSSEASVSMTTAAASFLDAQITAFQGQDTTTPLDASTTWSPSGANSTSFTTQAITTVTGNALLVCLIADIDGSSYTTPPSGFTERSESAVTAQKFVVADKTRVTAGTESSGTYTKSNSGLNGGNGIMLALRLAGASLFVPQVIAIT